MEIAIAIFLLITGVVLASKCSDIFIDAAKWMADVTGISKAVIGATVIAFATSAPELFVCLFAAMKGSADIATGNIVGSCIANIGICLGIIAIANPGKNDDKLFNFRGVVMIVMTTLLLGFVLTGTLSLVHGIVFLTIFAIYVYQNIRSSKTEQEEKTKKPTNRHEIILNLLLFAIGITGILIGSDLIAEYAKSLALSFGISEMIVGLTIVAVGTSAPEIITTIVALVKKEKEMGLGNLIGRHIFNIAIFAPIIFVAGSVPLLASSYIDVIAALLLAAIAIVPTLITKKLHRLQGAAMCAVYVGYLAYTVISAI